LLGKRGPDANLAIQMGEAELNYGGFRTPMFFTALGLTNNNLELKEALDSGLFPKFANHHHV
jgi:hypothetical protein